MLHCISIFTLFLLITTTSLAYQPKEGNISVLFGPVIYKNLFKPREDQVTPPQRLDFGLQIQGDTSSKGSLEIALIHLYKDFYRVENSEYAAEYLEVMEVDMGYRRWIAPSLNFGIFLSSTYAMTDGQTVKRIPENNFLETSRGDTTEFGIKLSLQGVIWERGNEGISLEYSYDRNTTARRNESQESQMFILSYRKTLQSKNKTVDSPK